MASQFRENALSERSESKGHPPHGSSISCAALMTRCTSVLSRVARHNAGTGAAHTAKHRPVRLVYTEEYTDRLDCLRRERQLKRWTRSKKEALIAGDKASLKKL